MLNCSACMERCLHGLIGNASLSTPSVRSSVVAATTLGREQLSRNFIISSSPSRGPRKPTRDDSTRYKERYADGPKREGGQYREDRKPSGLGYHLTNAEWKLEKEMGRTLTRFPVYGSDPLKLAEYIRKALKGDDFDTALAIVRAASKGLSCTVSWNHLIDWQMSKGSMNAALKTYNEMKKRGQAPDSHTYTIIIRGCTQHKDRKQALGKVMALYHSMLLDKSPVKPNTIHLNAIIKLCARAGDMDALFGVVGSMPTKGVTAPDNLTFTTILNALRMDCVAIAKADSRSNLTAMQQRQHARKAIEQARHMWVDITKRWRHGNIWIDEELVCSMGRLMLMGGERDWDDILSLVEQSMNIPRQVPRLGTSKRSKIHPASQGRAEAEPAESAIALEGSPEVGSEVEQQPALTTTDDNFKPITLPPPPKGVSSAYAKPGRNSLSLVMAAVDKLDLRKAAYKYWMVMVEEIGIRPDPENYHAYLRILRKARASSEAIELLKTMNLTEMRHSTFRIAIATCERDKRNPNAFSNAGKLLDMMTDALRVPDIPVLTSYLELAVSPHEELDRLEHGKRILRALDRLGPSMLNIKSLLIYGDAEAPMTKAELVEFQNSVLLLIRRMISAYDICMDRALVDRSKYSELTAHRAKLAAYVTRYKAYNALKEATPTVEGPTEIRELPEHLMSYVDANGLSKSMVLAQKSDKDWDAFVTMVTAEQASSNLPRDDSDRSSRVQDSRYEKQNRYPTRPGGFWP